MNPNDDVNVWIEYLTKRRAEFVEMLGKAPILQNSETGATGPVLDWDATIQDFIDDVDQRLLTLRELWQ